MEVHNWAAIEMSGATIKDGRRRKSLVRMVDRLARYSDRSFSAACGPDGRQAARRLFTHRDTTVDKLLHGHYAQTALRCSDQPLVLVVQDTTTVEFHTHLAAEGLGPVNDSLRTRGFFAHTAMALLPDGTPLGLTSLSLWARDPAEHGKTAKRRGRLPQDKESSKWRQAMEATERRLPADIPVLMIEDREADVFDFIAAPRRPGTHLLVRASQPRKVTVPVATEGNSQERRALFTVAAEAPVVGTMTATVPRRSARPGTPAREERQAELILRVTPALVQPPRRLGVTKTPAQLWIVRASEENPPEGLEKVEWVLLTTMPVPDGEAARQVVGHYARRWQIERLHYTLKSGCGAEKLQIDNAPALMHAVSLYFVVAWRLLHITHAARAEPERAPEEVLAPEELVVLEQASGKPIPTLHAAVRAIARLGGFEDYRSAPDPGVKSLWLGLRELEGLVAGWRLAAKFFGAKHQL